MRESITLYAQSFKKGVFWACNYGNIETLWINQSGILAYSRERIKAVIKVVMIRGREQVVNRSKRGEDNLEAVAKRSIAIPTNPTQ